jgi:AraC-like DNA-binding protein
MSESTLRRHFRKAFGVNPIEYIRNFRLGIAAKLLLSSNFTVKEISQMCGFNNPSYFCKSFQLIFHKTPQEYRLKQ